MKHVFVVNPCAGGHDGSGELAIKIHDILKDAEIYTTVAPRDATHFVRQCLGERPGGDVRFYACGGDGTLNEVVSGVMESESGNQRVEVACYPCGSGDDFVRYWQGEDFTDIAALVNGEAVPVDVMRLGDRYCVNTLNYGFEAAVCHHMAAVRRVPLLGGSMAYTTGIVASLATGRRNRCRVTVDGEPWLDGEVLLLSVANGQYAGGGYHCAPRAVNDDGMLEVMAVTPMSVARFAALIKYYKNGELLDREELRTVVSYRRGSRVLIDPLRDSYVATDGEIVPGRCFEAECLHRAINFVIPKK
jgi:diacylglycerol kinase (ATP)